MVTSPIHNPLSSLLVLGGLLAKKKSCVLSSALIRRRCFATADSRNKIDNDIVEMNGECDPVLRSPPRDNLGFVGGRELLWGLKWKLDFDNLRNEVGRPASELSPYRQTSLVMPSIEDVDRAVNTIREEERKLRRFVNWAIAAGVLLATALSSREADNFSWIVGTKFALLCIPPETAHHMVMIAARWGLLPSDTRVDDPALKIKICGIPFPNPIGLAAGFDKSCDNPTAFIKMGYGFVEVGTITPFPQEGNPKPRIFRLPDDKAVINRCGFNNDGVEAVARRLKEYSKSRWNHDLSRLGVIGVNIGKNKSSRNSVWDYSECAKRVAPFADYLVINVSSPNTPGLRTLQKKSELSAIVRGVQKVLDDLMSDVERQKITTLAMVRAEHPDIEADDSTFPFSLPTMTGKRPPIFIKLAPDLTEAEMAEIAEVVLEENVDGMIISNTTIARPPTLKTTDQTLVNECGGLSGPPLFDRSTEVVSQMYKLTGGGVPIIASGGISTGKDALDKIEAGASAVQIYTAMVYGGPGVSRQIKRQLSTLMYSKGYRNIQEAVGAAHREKRQDPIESGEGVPFFNRMQRKLKPPRFDDD